MSSSSQGSGEKKSGLKAAVRKAIIIDKLAQGSTNHPDKLKKGKRDGTPEKPNTPSASQEASAEDDATMSEKKVIVNPEILAMQIKEADLQKLRDPKPPSERKKTPVTTAFTVRKMKPLSELNKPKPKTVAVARPAPPDAPLKPVDYTSTTGARFDRYGNVIPHSILGSVEEFKKQALEHGDLPQDMAQIQMSDMDRPLTPKYEKKSRVSSHPQMQSVTESNALDNWQAKMFERRKQQGYLSKLLNKPPEQLVMNQADSYRKTQELRYMMDRTIPAVDYGKGYRVGSEFWKQQEPIGDDLTGINMSLTQTERGYPPPITHIGVPKTVLNEKGTQWDAPRTPLNKPWHKTKYLQERRDQLKPMMNELDSHSPTMENLEIVGKQHSSSPTDSGSGSTTRREVMEMGDTYESLTFPGGATVVGGSNSPGRDSKTGDQENEENIDPLSGHPDVHPAPVFGPSILFSGQPARWAGDSHTFNDQIGIEARVTFEAFAVHRVTSFLEIVNDGTTAMYYDWKKIPKTNPFDMVNAKVQRFYFNNSSGVILPGDTMRFPFVFKSPNAGVFTEQWKFETHPVVCGGAALIVTLRGVALQEDKFKYQRSQIENELNERQAHQIVGGILQEILDGIRSPDRPASPVDAYITDEEVFSRKNPGLNYDNETITQLREMYSAMFPEEERENAVWDLDMETLKQKLIELDEDDERKQEFLQKINQSVIGMSFPPFNPKQQNMYSVGYDLFCDLAEKIVTTSETIRQVLGMPDRATEEMREEPSRSDLSTPSIARSGKGSASEGKRQAAGGKGKADSKDKKAAGAKAGPGSPVKTASSKESNKSGGKITPGPGKRPNTTRSEKDTSVPRPVSAEQPQLPPGVDPILDQKYRDKMYTQSRDLLSQTFDQMDTVFIGIRESTGEGPQLPQLT